jgi:hypothetical protein
MGGHTVKGVHQGITGDCRASTASSSSEEVMLANLVTAHQVLDSFVSRKVNGVRRA